MTNLNRRLRPENDKSLIRGVIERYERLKQGRASWDSHCKDVRDYISPHRTRYENHPKDRNKKDEFAEIYDIHPRLYIRDATAGLMAGMSSPARPWFKLNTPYTDLNEVPAVKDWLYDVTRLLREIFMRSNYYDTLPNVYEEALGFANGAMIMLPDFQDVIRTYSYTQGTYCFGLDERLEVNQFYRSYTRTAGQLVRKYGRERVSTRTRELWDSNRRNQDVNVLHAIEPNDNPRQTGLSLDMPFRSYYLEMGENLMANTREGLLLEAGGYEEFPIMAARWYVNNGDTYGTDCPGMTALPDIETLQYEQLQKQTALGKKVDPAMVGPPELEGREHTTIPGGVTFVNFHNGVPQFQKAYNIDFQINELEGEIQEVKARLQSAFFIDLFRMLLNSDRRDITATEVLEKHEEKLVALGPVLQKLNGGLLKPSVERAFLIGERAGIFPDPPQELENVDLEVEFISVLAQAQQAVGISGVDRLTAYIGQLSELKPEAADKLNADKAIDEYAAMLGTPPGLVNAQSEVEPIREQRAELQRAQQMGEQAQQAANVASSLADTDTEAGALSDLLGN